MQDLARLFGKSKAQPEGRGRAILPNNLAKSKLSKIKGRWVRKNRLTHLQIYRIIKKH